MNRPRLFTTQEEIREIKNHISVYPWYHESYLKIKKFTDSIISRGFAVPDESGYVFFDTCPRDNTKLIFDPYRSDTHVCPACGVNFSDESYRRAWVLKYHAWLSQVSIYFGISYLIDGDIKYARAVKDVLCGYAEKYSGYPNNDNELGPTRVFQSTYMESIWIMYLAGACDMVRASGVFSADEEENIENNLFRASVEIIMDYDELWNNRQAFNNAGICAVGYLLNDRELIDHSLYGPHGFVNHMEKSILSDGLWYEGDNYHFATLPSMVSIAEMALRNGDDLYNREFGGNTLNMMFMAPLKSLQPDLTFPSRKDSAYASVIAQKWYAGLYEVAYKRYGEPAYADILDIAYTFPKEGIPSNAAGIMDVFDSAVSRRSDLDWRGFLNAEPELHCNRRLPYPKSINMEGTGLSVLRKNDTYLSLDYGDFGGGHGHPDRLGISYFYKSKRWLTDYGTCNYYFDQLRWYRSTIGHNTICIDGRTHLPVSGFCTGFDETEDIGFTSGTVRGIAPGVDIHRTLILLDDGLFLDIFLAESLYAHKYHNILHCYGELISENCTMCDASLNGENYEFLKSVKRIENSSNRYTFSDNGDRLSVIMPENHNPDVFMAMAFGPPDRMPERFPVLITEKTGGNETFITLFEALSDGEDERVKSFTDNGITAIELTDGSSYKIYRSSTSVTVGKYNNGNLVSSSSFQLSMEPAAQGAKHDLTGATDMMPETEGPRTKAIEVSADTDIDSLPWEANIQIKSRTQMRRGDRSWGGPEDISGEAMVFNRSGYLSVKCRVTDDNVLFDGGKFPYDNDSIQIYVSRHDRDGINAGHAGGTYGFLLVPGANGNASCLRPISRFSSSAEKTIACVKKTTEGYEAFIDIPWENIGGVPAPGGKIGFDIILNDRDSGERRDIQMVWSGCCEDERIYLKEDNHNPHRFGILEFE